MPPPLLLLQDISVTFGVTPLLTGAELAVASGDRVCLVGRNGSGKSTLLGPGWCNPMREIASPSPAPQSTICCKNRICPASPPP
jgi:ABC-type histidine transport system ATPase subunit